MNDDLPTTTPPPLFVVKWQHIDEPYLRHGKGTKRMSLEDCQAMCDELNADYPELHHEPCPV